MKMPTIEKGGQPSTTAWMVLIAFVVVQVRFIIPGSESYPPMTGIGYGAAMAAVGAIHVWREGQR